MAGSWSKPSAASTSLCGTSSARSRAEPIHRLLGGAYRDRIKVYASGVPATKAARGEADHGRMLAAAQSAVDRGFLGLKMAIGSGPAADIASVTAVRELVGPDMAIFADARPGARR